MELWKDYIYFKAFKVTVDMIQLDDLDMSTFKAKKGAVRAYAQFLEDAKSAGIKDWICYVPKNGSKTMNILYRLGAMPYAADNNSIFFWKEVK